MVEEKKKRGGTLTVDVVDGVDIEVRGRNIKVKGGLGEVSWRFKEDFINLTKDESKITVSAKTKRFPYRKQMAIMGAIAGHIKNMMKGVTKGYIYKLQTVYSHFPMKVLVKGQYVVIENFLGEKYPRKAKIHEGVKVEIKGPELTVTGIHKENVGQTAANIEQATKVRNLDVRVFQDGIYIIQKDAEKIGN